MPMLCWTQETGNMAVLAELYFVEARQQFQHKELLPEPPLPATALCCLLGCPIQLLLHPLCEADEETCLT